MKAIAYQQSLPITEPNALMDVELPKPEAAGHDLLVRIHAISVNPVDTKIRQRLVPESGEYKVLGWDAVGTVEAVGDQATLFSAGDTVWYAGALNRQGTNAQYHLVDERIAAKAPTSLSHTDAAALPLTSITAWEMLFDRFAVNADTKGTLLIIGASGGGGSVMVQLAKKLTQLTVIATASRPETREWVSGLGADHVIDHHQNMNEQLAALDIPNVNYIASLNNTGGHLPSIIEAIAPQGKVGLIDDPESFDIMPFKMKCVSVHWEFMFTRSLFATDDMIEQHVLLSKVAKMVDDGELVTTTGNNMGVMNAENVIKAHQLLESGKAKGKIVLSVE
jgi:zinc-binding alcohol dehydrogenase family protein